MTPETVLEFWFEDGLQSGWPGRPMGDLWFGGGAAIDDRIRTQFGESVTLAVDGGLVHWETPLLHRLALVILLDQFTRNVFRGQARAFAGDARALALATRTLAHGEDAALPLVGRVFIAMPLMHAEDLASQEACVQHFERLVAHLPAAEAQRLQGNLDAAREHRDIVQRYGRFPHRNAALGRSSTADEQAYLQAGRRFGQ